MGSSARRDDGISRQLNANQQLANYQAFFKNSSSPDQSLYACAGASSNL
jgi:hypothetical protein